MLHWSYRVTSNDPLLECTGESTFLVTTLLKTVSYLVQYNSLISFRSATKFKAISRKVVGKSARDNPESFNCRWFWLLLEEIWKNGTRGHGRMFPSAKGKQQK